MQKTALYTALALAASAGGAFAGNPAPAPVEPVVAVPVAAPAPFWEGAYVGAQLGYAYGDFEFSGDTFDNDSAIGGLTAGYLWSLGNGWYLGPEFQYDWADITITDATSGGDATFEEIARLKLIAGYELGQGLLYGSAGIAYASLDGVGSVFDGFDGSDTSWVVGLGYDYRIGDNWTIGAEYMYHSFTNIGSDGGDVDVNTLQVKGSYRF
jgi:outer membrane immunogenic protein